MISFSTSLMMFQSLVNLVGNSIKRLSQKLIHSNDKSNKSTSNNDDFLNTLFSLQFKPEPLEEGRCEETTNIEGGEWGWGILHGCNDKSHTKSTNDSSTHSLHDGYINDSVT